MTEITQKKIGAHMSISRGLLKMGEETVKIGANTLQCFLRNPRGSRSRDIPAQELEAFQRRMKEYQLGPIVVHAPYTLNGCSPDPHIRELSLQMMREDLERMEKLPGNFYNLHPGSRIRQPLETAIDQIASMVDQASASCPGTTVLLETMAGKGSEVGGSFQELREILDRLPQTDRFGVCMDACHVWDAGYDIRDRLDEVLEEFDRVIGLRRLKAFHMNDSLSPLGSRKDRHATLGDGTIGAEALFRLWNHPALSGLPFLLETPTDTEGHRREIQLLKDASEPLAP